MATRTSHIAFAPSRPVWRSASTRECTHDPIRRLRRVLAFASFLPFLAYAQNTTGSNNTANGYYALYGNTGSYNTAIGVQHMQTNTTGVNNVAAGHQALFGNTTGSYDEDTPERSDQLQT